MNRLGVACDTSELQKLMRKHPDYPIVFLVDSEVVADVDYSGSWFCNRIDVYVGEILDCDYDDEKIYTDRGEFEDDLREEIAENQDKFSEHCEDCWQSCEKCDFEMSDDELEEVLKEQLEDYEQYWIDCIIVHGRN